MKDDGPAPGQLDRVARMRILHLVEAGLAVTAAWCVFLFARMTGSLPWKSPALESVESVAPWVFRLALPAVCWAAAGRGGAIASRERALWTAGATVFWELVAWKLTDGFRDILAGLLS